MGEYNRAARRPKEGRNGTATPRSDDDAPIPLTCHAFACPMPAGIVREGKRFCAVHYGIPDFGDFDAATRVIDARPDLVEAIKVLRNPTRLADWGNDADAAAYRMARSICPDVKVAGPGRYVALACFEQALIDLAQAALVKRNHNIETEDFPT